MAAESLDMVETVDILDRNRTSMAVKRLRTLDIAKATGLSKSTIIRYEEEGKLPSAKRDGRGWRYYSEDDREIILEKLRKMKLI